MVTRCSSPTKASLLSYLHRVGEDARLSLSLFPDIPGYQDRAYPFVVLDDTDATSRLIEASFVTDAGSLLKKVILLVQKDRYSLREEEFSSVTNTDIDTSWQAAFRSFTVQIQDGSRVLLSSQTDNQGRLVRLASLFFCRERRLFFHPVCPSCGVSLDLCTDDALLKRHGLQAYTSTAKRYLYCSACCDVGLQEFYLYEQDPTDPVTIRDRWSLVDRFRSVTEEKNPTGMFPCVDCPEYERCYGPNHEARARITPFSFYPFYLLIYDAPSLHAFDFVQLASGATFEETEARLNVNRHPGRIGRLKMINQQGRIELPHFPWSDERSFLDVLSLKISFLGKVVHRFIRRNRPGSAAVSEKIWIRVAPPESTRKLFQSFDIEILEDVNPRANALEASDADTDLFGHVGSLWFQVLLQNMNVSQGEIISAVMQYHSRRPEGLPSTTTAPALKALCVPENIFWDSTSRKVPREWLPLWERGCAIGFLLLDAASNQGKKIGADELMDSVNHLLTDIERTAFSVLPPLQVEPPRVETRRDDQLLLDIVTKLIEQCRSEIQTGGKPQPSEVDDEEVATVILSPQRFQERKALPPEDDMITETVVLTAQTVSQRRAQQYQEAGADDRLTETVLLNHGRVSQPVSSVATKDDTCGSTDNTAEIKDNEANRLGDTVILASESANLETASQHSEVSPDDLLEETVFLTTGRRGQPVSNDETRKDVPGMNAPLAEAERNEADQLGETVVIMPKKGKTLSRGGP